MTTLSPAQLAYYNYKYFGDLGPQVVADMTATALAESGGRMVVGAQNQNGSYDRSAWQINDVHGYDRQRLIDDPDYAAQAARDVYDKQGIDAWAGWTSGNAYDHWDEAAGAVQTLYATDHPESLAPLTSSKSAQQTWQQKVAQLMAQGNLLTGAAAGPSGQTGGAPVMTGQETLTGVELTQLAAYLSNMLAQTRQSGLEGAGYSDLGALGIPGGGIGPSLSRMEYEQRALQAQQTYGLDTQRVELQRQQLENARLDAERQYGLDVQRFGLQYADTAYRQRLETAVQQTNQLKTLASFQGPRDWLRYNYLENNMPAPVTPTVTGPAPQVQPTVTGQAPQLGPNGLPLQSMQFPKIPPPQVPLPKPPVPQPGVNPLAGAPSAYYNPTTGQTEEEPRNEEGIYSENWTPSTNAPVDLGNGQQTGSETIQSANPAGGSYFWDPEGSGGIGFRDESGAVKYLAFGGYSDQGMGGMHRAVVGDPQRRGRPNPELVMSRSPITAVPLRGNKRARTAARGKPRMATGGTTFQNTGGLPASQIGNVGYRTLATGGEVAGDPAITGAPFVTKVTQGGAPSFGARAEDLGPYGRSPLNYSSMLRLLPSEQEMMRGYIETPPELGGLGGWFPDEAERAKRSSFQGLDFGPSGYAAA